MRRGKSRERKKRKEKQEHKEEIKDARKGMTAEINCSK